MDRRDSLKSMLIGGITGGLILTGCKPVGDETVEVEKGATGDYGRTDAEKAHDARLHGETFFTEHELTTIAVLCDLILPATPSAGSATDAGVPEFIEFISKDITAHQLPLRGGIMWLDHESNTRFGTPFTTCIDSQQKQLLDEIAYPDKATPELVQGVSFFSLMRNLVLTGYYTTRMGLDDLGYEGNVPNVWDGVPDEVLKKHGLEYDKEWLEKCIDQETRDVVAEWDDEGRLVR